ncbi:MAG: hypothetical protein WC613_03280 [Candidatus Aenigmatarchaeota archaeon]
MKTETIVKMKESKDTRMSSPPQSMNLPKDRHTRISISRDATCQIPSSSSVT